MKPLRLGIISIGVVLSSMLGVGAARAASGPLLDDTFAKAPVGITWTDGSVVSAGARWRVRFAGYGSVQATDAGPSRVFRLAPAVATAPTETHAALMVSETIFNRPCVNLTTRMRTTKQLRTGSPANAWESAWLVWDFTDEAHFYYLAVKPNGWELGKRDPAYPGGQRFLATGSSPATAVGQWRNVAVTRSAGVLTVLIDGKRVARFNDVQQPYGAGSVGMYTEDAVADWDSMRVVGC